MGSRTKLQTGPIHETLPGQPFDPSASRPSTSRVETPHEAPGSHEDPRQGPHSHSSPPVQDKPPPTGTPPPRGVNPDAVLSQSSPKSGAVTKDTGHKPKGTFFNDGRRRIDFVLTYEKMASEDLADPSRGGPTSGANRNSAKKKSSSAVDDAKRRQFFLDNLRKAGLELEIDEQQADGAKSSSDSVKLLGFVKIHAPWPVLCREAEILRMKMPLILEDLSEDDRNDDHLTERESLWSRVWNLRYLEIHQDDDAKGERITWPFTRKRMDRFDIAKRGEDGFFTVCQRTEIVWEILQQCRNDPNHEKRRGVEALLEHRVFSDAFPLHDGNYDVEAGVDTSDNAKLTTRQVLYYQWANWKSTFRPQPLNRIRNYFGEKVAFYFGKPHPVLVEAPPPKAHVCGA